MELTAQPITTAPQSVKAEAAKTFQFYLDDDDPIDNQDDNVQERKQSTPSVAEYKVGMHVFGVCVSAPLFVRLAGCVIVVLCVSAEQAII